MASAIVCDYPIEMGAVSIRRVGEIAAICVEGKENAVALRQRLVRQGVSCSFPVATWEHAKFEFHAKRPTELSHASLVDLVQQLIDSE